MGLASSLSGTWLCSSLVMETRLEEPPLPDTVSDRNLDTSRKSHSQPRLNSKVVNALTSWTARGTTTRISRVEQMAAKMALNSSLICHNRRTKWKRRNPLNLRRKLRIALQITLSPGRSQTMCLRVMMRKEIWRMRSSSKEMIWKIVRTQMIQAWHRCTNPMKVSRRKLVESSWANWG